MSNAIGTRPSPVVRVRRPLPALPSRPSADTVRSLRERLVAFPSSMRTRILAYVIGLLALATALFIAVSSTVLDIRLDNRIDAELTQEAAELRRLAAGYDPRTGHRFGSDVQRIFDVYFQRNVPSKNEAMITFVAGKPYLRSRAVVPYRLDRDAELVGRWAFLTAVERSHVQTPAGRVDYLALPIAAHGRTEGVFVAALFRDRLQADYDATVLAAGATGLGVLLIGSLLAWRLAGRVVGPVTRLTTTARTISETDLSRRIVVEGRDEVAQQAATFNEMLDRLEAAFQAQRAFLDDAGHELRTPLTIVLGNLELLPDDPRERAATVDLLTDELERMSRLVDDFLLLAKRQQPDFLELATVDIGAFTDELAAKVESLDARQWIVESRGQGIVVADRYRLTQAMLQLAENAVHHSGKPKPIRIGSSVSESAARLWVRDEGAGVPAEEQARVFERFQRASAEDGSRGSGLGLPIVKAIAEAHGGRVELESDAGRGATFTIVIPLDHEPEKERR